MAALIARFGALCASDTAYVSALLLALGLLGATVQLGTIYVG